MSDNNYEAVVWNEIIGNATMNVISGRPDCFDTIEDGLTFAEAAEVAANHTGNCAIRKMGERNYIARGPEVRFVNNVARKTGLDGQELIDEFKAIYYGEGDERWEYVE